MSRQGGLDTNVKIFVYIYGWPPALGLMYDLSYEIHKRESVKIKDASLPIPSSPLQYLVQGCKAKCTCFSLSNNVGNGVVSI